MNYEQLLTAADQEGLPVKEQPLTEHDGLICGRRVAIRRKIATQKEKSCVLAEELGHYYTSSGDIWISLRLRTVSRNTTHGFMGII